MNVAREVNAVGAEKVTDPGPETADQLYVNAPGGEGSPSSAAVPVSVTELVGSVMV